MKSVAQVLYRRLRATSALVSFSPSSLFASGEQGVWYDPSDLTTMFQDAAGTTPVTAVEQPVGLRLDKSRGGVGTNGAKRVNLLSWSEAFDNAAWEKQSIVTVTADTTASPTGTNTADSLFETATTGFHSLRTNLTIATAAAGSSYKFTAHVKANGRTKGFLSVVNGGGFSLFDLSAKTNVFGGNGTNETVTSQTIEELADGWFLLTITSAFSGAASVRPVIGIQNDAGSSTYLGDVTKGFYVWGADLRLASEASTLPTYQPITATWRDTIPGNHAFQTTLANRPVLSARVNLLTRTEEFDNAAWVKTSLSFSGSKMIPSAVSGAHGVTQDVADITDRKLYVEAKADGYSLLAIGSGLSTGPTVTVDLSTGLAVRSAGAGVLSSSVTAMGDGYYAISVTISQASRYDYALWVTQPAGSGDPSVAWTGDGTSGILIRKPDHRAPNDGVGLPPYQRVVDATTYDTTGFPLYLRYNGTNSAMQTAAIDFTSTDKMSVFAGIRQLSAASISPQVVVELSAMTNSNAGSFLLDLQDGAAAEDAFYSRGSGSLSGARWLSAPTSPQTSVYTAQANIGAPSVSLRVDAVQVASSTTSQGTGNYGSYPLYLGARAGNQLWFNGRDYGIIIVGKTVTAAELANTENYMETKTFGKDMNYVYVDQVFAADGITEITAADGDPIYMTVQYQ